MNEHALSTVLCGIGGYGKWYLDRFLESANSPLQFVGFVDPFPAKAPDRERIKALQLPVFPTLEAFYENHTAELAILASPIQAHCPQTLLALAQGSHVLTEKPLCATTVDARRMLEAARQAKRVVAVGYQDSFTPQTQTLKRDIAAGRFGRPQRFSGLAVWPRGRAYYGRNAWAGRLRDDNGQWTMDSPVNNAVAHYLHMMFYLLGETPSHSAVPVQTQAALARAHAIENYDTAFVRSCTASGVEILFYATHTGLNMKGPIYRFEFENGVLNFDHSEGMARVVLSGGETLEYGKITGSSHAEEKVFDTVAAIGQGRESLCGIEAAASQTLCMSAAQESGAPVRDFAPQRISDIEQKGDHWRTVAGLEAILDNAFATGTLPDGSDWPELKAGPPVASDRFYSCQK